MKKRDFVTLLILAVILTASGLLSIPQTAQRKQGDNDPTVVQKGNLSEKQRRHSKEFEDREYLE